MRYRNTKTGNVIESPCVIVGGSWEPVKKHDPEDPSGKGNAAPPEKKPKAARGGKNT